MEDYLDHIPEIGFVLLLLILLVVVGAIYAASLKQMSNFGSLRLRAQVMVYGIGILVTIALICLMAIK